jgi:hypothetical protein
MKEPLWRSFLCWGVVISFFLLPTTAFVVVIFGVCREPTGMLTAEEINSLRAFTGYESTLAALLFGLAGLNTWDRHNGQKLQKQGD